MTVFSKLTFFLFFQFLPFYFCFLCFLCFLFLFSIFVFTIFDFSFIKIWSHLIIFNRHCMEMNSDRFIRSKPTEVNMARLLLDQHRCEGLPRRFFRRLDAPGLTNMLNFRQRLVESTANELMVALDDYVYTYDVRSGVIVELPLGVGRIQQVYRSQDTMAVVVGTGHTNFQLNGTLFVDIDPVAGGGWDSKHTFTALGQTATVAQYDGRTFGIKPVGTLQQVDRDPHAVFAERHHLIVTTGSSIAAYDLRSTLTPCAEVPFLKPMTTTIRFLAVHPVTGQIAVVVDDKLHMYSALMLQLERVVPLFSPAKHVVWVGDIPVVSLKDRLYVCAMQPYSVFLDEGYCCSFLTAWPERGVILLDQRRETLLLLEFPKLYTQRLPSCTNHLQVCIR